jgi:hypothetical protein
MSPVPSPAHSRCSASDPVFSLLYLDAASPWIFSQTLGWAYSVPAGGDSGIWLFLDDVARWFWTDDTVYPYVYDDTDGRYFYLEESDGIRFLFDFTTGSWLRISR